MSKSIIKGIVSKASLDDIRKAFDAIGIRLERKITAEAVQHGTAIIVEAARRNAPVDQGAYKYALTARKPRYSKKTRGYTGGLGVDHKMLFRLGKGRRPSNLWHLLEYGHVKANQYGRNGWVAAKPHIRPALDQYGETVIRVMSRFMLQRINEEAEKLARKSLRKRAAG